MKRLALIACLAATVAVAADDPKQKEDLAAVIALQGKPCGEVVSYTVQGENDFLATCKDNGQDFFVQRHCGRSCTPS